MAGQTHVPKEVKRYLIPTEGIIFLVHRHWIVLLEPILTALAGLCAVLFVSTYAPGKPLKVTVVLWVALLLRVTFHYFEWHHEIFLATGSRLMLIHGLTTRKVDIMPMAKVTDMRYDRSLIGKIFGYGVFILESAGQDQALSKINYIPDPDVHYKQISAVIFAPVQRRLPDRMEPATTGSRVPISEPERAWWRRS
jgi:uncharacterized membrane protein YdbT with pleckstrin-like domain